MTLKTAIIVLEYYNKWRRGDETLDQPSPKRIGEAIDIVVKHYEETNEIKIRNSIEVS